jgi:hypothetical protein
MLAVLVVLVVLAEAERFELSKPLSGLTRFQDEVHRPLGHAPKMKL